MCTGWRYAVAGLAVAAAFTLVGSAAEGASKGSRWRADYFPNVPLITQDGETVHFYDDLIKDKVVVINFIFTSCNDVCPAETARLRQVQKELGDRVGHDVFMYSITIDPENDTPEVLKRYSDKFRVRPGWLFLTGKAEDIALLQKKLGLFIADLPDPEDHNVNLIVGNEATGRWMKRSPYDDPKILAEVIGSWLHNWTVPSKSRDSYANRPTFPKRSRGEYLFRTRCVSCHAMGSDGPLGPDLLGVTERRDPAWLARWLKEPDRMLAEKDPTAMALFARYRELPMPNLSLNDVDVSALIAYMASASRKAASANLSEGQRTQDAGHIVRANQPQAEREQTHH
ncbi:MAG: SCO family protein [Myxococcota bacterium]